MVLERDRMLRYQGPQILLAADGEEGWSVFCDEQPDLLITDLLMPKVDGFELVERVRGHAHGKALPILIVTAIVRDRQVLSRLERDFKVVVQAKPFAPKLLAQRVRGLLQKERDGRTAGERPSSVARSSAAARPASQQARAPKVAPRSPIPTATAAGQVGLPVDAQQLPVELQRAPAFPPRRPAELPGSPKSTAPLVFGRARELDVQLSSRPAHVTESPSATRAEVVASAQRSRTPLDVAIEEAGDTREGKIGEPPLPRLLLNLWIEQATGALELRRNKVRKVIYLQGGHPIFVQSNVRAETLGQLLVRRGGLSEAQHGEALVYAERNGLKYGEALVAIGVMNEAEVMSELVRQTRFKVQSSLRWSDGTWRFHCDEGVGARVPRCVVEPLEAIFQGLARPQDLQNVVTQLVQRGLGQQLKLGESFAAFEQAFVEAFGSSVLAALRGAPMMAALIHSDTPPAQVMAVDALLRCELCELVPAPARAPEFGVAAEEGPAIDAVSRSASVRADALEGLLRAAPTAQEMVAPPVLAGGEFGELDGGRMRLSGTWARSSAEAELSEKDRVARALVEAAYLNLHEQSYYEVLGVIPETDENGIEVAYRIKRAQFDLGRFRDRDLGEAYSHLEELCTVLDEAHRHLSDPLLRAAYDAQALGNVKQRRSRAIEAETIFKRGLEQLAHGRAFEAGELFEQALRLDNRPEYRVQQAYAHFLVGGESESAGAEAMVRVQAALADNPEQPEAHLVAAQICRGLGASAEALEHLSHVLRLEPGHRAAFGQQEEQLRELGDYRRLEAEYRRTIFHLGSRELAWTAALWKGLVALYRDQLQDRERARKACDAAFRLNPEDGEVRAWLLQLDSADPERWPKAVLGYRALLRSNATDIGPLRELFALHRIAGRDDAASLAAAAAVFRGAREPLMIEAARCGRKTQFRLAADRLDDASWKFLRHPYDDHLLARLFDLLTPLMDELNPLTDDDLGLSEGADERISLSSEFMAMLRYVGGMIGMRSLPSVRLNRELDRDIEAIGTERAVLLVGETCAGLQDRPELVFRLGRALVRLLPGNKCLGWRPPELLRDYLMAVVALAYPEMELPEFSEEAMSVYDRISLSDGLLAACRALVEQLHDRGRELDLDRWGQGLRFTADRLGLLLCGDISVASLVLGDVTEESQVELLDFALGEHHAQLRQKLGLNC